jgi:cellobiose-specific phosphotransferase system component IIB
VVNQALKQEEDRLFAIFKRELKGDIKKYIVSLLAPQVSVQPMNLIR